MCKSCGEGGRQEGELGGTIAWKSARRCHAREWSIDGLVRFCSVPVPTCTGTAVVPTSTGAPRGTNLAAGSGGPGFLSGRVESDFVPRR